MDRTVSTTTFNCYTCSVSILQHFIPTSTTPLCSAQVSVSRSFHINFTSFHLSLPPPPFALSLSLLHAHTQTLIISIHLIFWHSSFHYNNRSHSIKRITENYNIPYYVQVCSTLYLLHFSLSPIPLSTSVSIIPQTRCPRDIVCMSPYCSPSVSVSTKALLILTLTCLYYV